MSICDACYESLDACPRCHAEEVNGLHRRLSKLRDALQWIMERPKADHTARAMMLEQRGIEAGK